VVTLVCDVCDGQSFGRAVSQPTPQVRERRGSRAELDSLLTVLTRRVARDVLGECSASVGQVGRSCSRTCVEQEQVVRKRGEQQ
jgi:hypothetical protein